VVGPLGFEPRPSGEMQRSHHHVCFISAASFPFFVEKVVFAKASLAGDETNECKNSKLPSLRQNHVTRLLRGQKSRTSKMPKMWQSQNVERRETIHTFGNVSTLLLPRLRVSVLTVISQSLISFFLFQNCFSKFTEENRF
jgi:hypothetical protein